MFFWSYCLAWWQWLARPWPWSVDRGQCSPSRVTTSVVEGIRCCQSLMLPWMMNYIWHLCMCKCMCMCFAHSWPVHPLTHLPRADTGICLFYCQNIKANSQRGSSTASRVACHQGVAYFDRFRQSWGGNSATAGVTWRLYTEYVLKYTAYIQTCACVGERLCLLAASQPWLV